MLLADLRRTLLTELAVALATRGYRKNGQSFRKDEGPHRLSFHVAFINHSEDFDVTADVAVRHHAVEERLNGSSPLLSAAQKKETATVGAELGNLAGVGQHRWTVRERRDIEPVAADMLQWFDRIGVPFLTRFSSLDEVARVLAQDDALARLVCPIPGSRRKVLDVIEHLRAGSAP
jgi:hypothetical protein